MACNGAHPRVAVIAIVSDDNGRIVAGKRRGPLGTGASKFANIGPTAVAYNIMPSYSMSKF